MTDIFSNLKGIVQNIFYVGDLLIKNVSGVFEFKNESDALVKLSCATPTIDDNVMTKGSVLTIQAIRNYQITDTFADIKRSATTDGELSECVMVDKGEIIGISAWVEKTRTGGTASFYPTLNDVAQNGTGEFVTIDGTNSKKTYVTISPSISYNAGDSIGIRCVTTNFAPNATRAVAGLRIRNRE